MILRDTEKNFGIPLFVEKKLKKTFILMIVRKYDMQRFRKIAYFLYLLVIGFVHI